MFNFLQQAPIILASGSAIRARLLDSLGLDFTVVPSHVDEAALKLNHGKDPLDLGYLLAQSKALEVSNLYPTDFVIAADQLCVIEQQILDKPMNHATAIKHLGLLSGKTHEQIACLCIAKNNQVLWSHHETATLTMRELADETIEAYLQKEQPYQSCGAYQFETLGKWLFKEVHGQEDTILGLPLLPLIAALTNLNAVHY